jgi:transcriptional repressor NrdR
MRCPSCRSLDSNVIDSRLSKDGDVIRRRRRCVGCGRRFTTYERIEESLPVIVKKDDRRETYDRSKVVGGIKKACEKRPVSMDTIELVADRVARQLQEEGAREAPSSLIGEAIMGELRELDTVAYVRFASVYRSFEDVGEFMREVRELSRTIKSKSKTKSKGERGRGRGDARRRPKR